MHWCFCRVSSDSYRCPVNEIDLNEREHFLKGNMDWSDIDLSWITLSVHGPKVATPNMSCFTVIKPWCLRSLTFRSPYVVKTTNIQCHWLPVILFICNQTLPDSNVSSVQFGRERGREYENSALKIQEMLSERSRITNFSGGACSL